MRTYIRALGLIAATLIAGAANAPDPLDIGSCYSVRPICLSPQVPICICDIVRNCFWACR